MPSPRKPNPKFKHLAPLIIGYMKREGITGQEMGRRLGAPNGSGAVISGWIRSLNAPSEQYRAKLAELLGVDESELKPRVEGKAREATARALEAHLQAPAPPPQVLLPRRQDNVLSYSAASDGQAEVKLLARGPHARMAVVFRLLLDAGLVPGGEEDPE